MPQWTVWCGPSLGHGDASQDIPQMVSRGLQAPLRFPTFPDALPLQDLVQTMFQHEFKDRPILFPKAVVLLNNDEFVVIGEARQGTIADDHVDVSCTDDHSTEPPPLCILAVILQLSIFTKQHLGPARSECDVVVRVDLGSLGVLVR